MEKEIHILLISLLLFSLLSCVSAQSCSQTVTPTTYITFARSYMDTTVINPSVPGCTTYRNTHFRCNYDVILGDNNTASSATPDVSSSLFREQFVAWQRNADPNEMAPFIDFDFTGISNFFTAVELSFFNNPAEQISIPEIELSRVVYNTGSNSFSADMITPIASRLLGNQDLTQADNQVRTVYIRPLIGQSNLNLRMSFRFNQFHNFNTILLSEVRFCMNSQPRFTPVPAFLAPLSNTILEPSAADLGRRSTELVCTISEQGPYMWVWERDNSQIFNSLDYQIYIEDGSRTTKLTILNLAFSSAAEYECTGTVVDLTNQVFMNSSVQEVQFPEIIITAPDVSGYLQTGEVALNCELHGYQSSLAPPVWLDSSGSEVSDSTKYTLSSGQGGRTIIFEDGRTVPSMTVSLVIQNLSPADEGNYTCRGSNSQSVTQLIIVQGTAPPTTLPPTTQPLSTISSDGTTEPSSTQPSGSGNVSSGAPADNTPAVVAAVVVVLLLVIIIAVVLIVLLFVYLRFRDNKVNISPTPNGNSYIEVNPKRRLTANDIQWRLSGVRNEQEETDTAHIYSMVDKTREVSLPPVPPQEFDETDFGNMDFKNKVATTEDGDSLNLNQYEELDLQPGLQAPKRRGTNTTKPKLVKLTKADPKNRMDSNPIYESTSVVVKSSKINGNRDSNPLYDQTPDSRDSFITVSSTSASDGEPLYSEAIHSMPYSSSSLSKSEEPVYSEALNPTNFKPTQSVSSDLSNLLPYGPVYALPSVVTKSNKPFSVFPENIQEMSELGIGQFGEVVLAETVGLSEKDLKLGESTDKNARFLVAIKKLKDKADSTMKESFEKEISFMSGLADENIVRLLGVCNKEPKFIVIEYMQNGDLYQFLNRYELASSVAEIQENQIPLSILLYMGVQIASGMRYLASLKYVHRDLASRNCLVGQNFIVKISDFGMSRNLYESVYYRVKGRAMLPIRWMAMESFRGRFSEKTDVWSFGVTMWEIFTLGRFQPYEDLEDQDIIHDATQNKQRKLLPKPEACPEEVYSVMLRCWEYKMDDRASFAEIFNSLSEIQQNM